MAMVIGVDVTDVFATLVGSEVYRIPSLGQIYEDQLARKYKFVQYNAGAGAVAAVAGQVTAYYAPSGVSAGSTNIVTSDVSDSAALGSGVLQSAPTNGQYCWIQVSGPATLSIALTSGGDGNALCIGAADGTLKVSAAVTDTVCAHAVDASARVVMCRFPH